MLNNEKIVQNSMSNESTVFFAKHAHVTSVSPTVPLFLNIEPVLFALQLLTFQAEINASCLQHADQMRVQYAISCSIFLCIQGFLILKKHDDAFITENQDFWHLLLSLFRV